METFLYQLCNERYRITCIAGCKGRFEAGTKKRALYSMIELNNGPDKPHRKSARIVGDTMGKYHPHGDSSIYGALVNMAQAMVLSVILW